MKPLSIFTIIFLVIAVSHANTNSDDNNQDESSSSNLGPNPLIRLPTQTSNLDLTDFLNRRRINLRNRHRVPLTARYVPRRCRHRFTTFGPGVAVDPNDDLATIMKKQAEVIRHQHVDGKFNPTVELKQDAVGHDEVKAEYDGEWKADRPHHHHHHAHHHHHHHSDHSDDSDDESDKIHDEVHAHGFNHRGYNKKQGYYIMRKIRKFLSHFI